MITFLAESTITWPEAFQTVGITAAGAFMVWAIYKFNN